MRKDEEYRALESAHVRQMAIKANPHLYSHTHILPNDGGGQKSKECTLDPCPARIRMLSL